MATNYTALTSLTNASANTATSMLMDQVKAMITANPAWTVVDDTAGIGTSAVRYLCFKNAAAQSGLPNDYYVLFTQFGTNMTVWMGENYNATTHVLSNCAPGLYTSSVAVSATGQLASSPTVTPSGSTGQPISSGTTTPHQINISPGTTTIYYQCVVYADHFHLAAGSNTALSTSSVYVGGYEVLTSGGEPYPIVLGDCKNTTTAASGFQTTREIPAYFSTSKTYFGQVAPWLGSSAVATEFTRASYAASDAAQGTTYTASPFLVMGNNGGSSAFNNTRGRFKNMVVSAAVPASMAIGDTVQIGNTYWTYIPAGGSYHYIDTGVAAP